MSGEWPWCSSTFFDHTGTLLAKSTAALPDYATAEKVNVFGGTTLAINVGFEATGTNFLIYSQDLGAVQAARGW